MSDFIKAAPFTENLLQKSVAEGVAYRMFLELSLTTGQSKVYRAAIGARAVGLFSRDFGADTPNVRYEVYVGTTVNATVGDPKTVYPMNALYPNDSTSQFQEITPGDLGTLVDLDITRGGGVGANPTGGKFDETNDYRVFAPNSYVFVRLYNPTLSTVNVLLKLKWHEFNA